MVIIMRMMKMKMFMKMSMVMMMTLTNPFVCAKFHCEVNLCLAARSHLASIVGVRMVDGDCRGQDQDQERC